MSVEVNVFELPPTPTVPVVGGGRYPVRRIYCVGRNYAAHAHEMGFEVDREAPFFFLKPADAIVADGAKIAYPRMSHNYHHEIELVVAIGKPGRDVPIDKADDHIFGYAVGLDMTRRDLQLAARDKGRPWDTGKAFDESAPCGAITRKESAGDIRAANIRLGVNGEKRQASPLSLLIWSVDESSTGCHCSTTSNRVTSYIRVRPRVSVRWPQATSSWVPLRVSNSLRYSSNEQHHPESNAARLLSLVSSVSRANRPKSQRHRIR